MTDLLRMIYDEIIICEKETININRETEGKIKSLIEPYTAKLDGEEKEAFEDMCYDIFYHAEYSGFRVRIRFALETLIEILRK